MPIKISHTQTHWRESIQLHNKMGIGDNPCLVPIVSNNLLMRAYKNVSKDYILEEFTMNVPSVVRKFLTE